MYAIRSYYGLFIMPPSGKARPNMWYFPISPMSMASVGRQPNSVITSYSIHYTKLYDGRYTVFGRVIEGFEVLDRIEVGDRIIRVRIERTGPARAAF